MRDLCCSVSYAIQKHPPAEYQGRLSTGELPDDACQVVIQASVEHELVLGGGVGAHHSAQLDWPHLLPIHLRLHAPHTNKRLLREWRLQCLSRHLQLQQGKVSDA